MYTSNGYRLNQSPHRLGELTPTPDKHRHDREALWRLLRQDGYLYLPGALDPDRVHGFRDYYFDQLADTGLTAPGTDPGAGIAAAKDDVDVATMRNRIFREIVPGTQYERFCRHPAIAGWYEWFLSGEPFLHRRKIIRHLSPGETGIGTATQAHYDLVYLREGSDRVLSSWIPLGDCPPTRGGLMYLENSHHHVGAEEAAGRLRHPAASITADLPALADTHDTRWLMADYRAGDMVVHSAYTVHAALDNVDPDRVIRLSTDIRYQRRDQPIDWRWQDHWHDQDGL